jgi:hypothetical protein
MPLAKTRLSTSNLCPSRSPSLRHSFLALKRKPMKDSATNCLNGRAAPTHRRSGAPAAVSRMAFDLRDGRRVIVGSSLGGGVDDCGERRRTCMEGEAVCSRLRLRGCPSLLAQGQRRGSPCRSLQCRDLLPAPRLGRFCRNSVSCNGCLPEIGLASRCFSGELPCKLAFCREEDR